MSTDKDQRFIDAVERGMPTAMAAQAVYGTAVPPRPAAPEHNHVTRDIKPVGKCPACDDYWGTNWGYPTPADSPAAADSRHASKPPPHSDGRNHWLGGDPSLSAAADHAAPDAAAGDRLREALIRALTAPDGGAWWSPKVAADALLALREIRGVGPLSTTIGYLIRAGFLVPADPPPTTLDIAKNWPKPLPPRQQSPGPIDPPKPANYHPYA